MFRKDEEPISPSIFKELYEKYKQKAKSMIVNGDPIKTGSLRYGTFADSVKCAACGIEGTRVYKEKTDDVHNRFHLNLYAFNGREEVLMTKDHIKPRSKGGANTLSNLQTMCCVCNVEKGDS